MGPREPAPAVSVIEEEPYREVDWIELMPEDDLQALMSPPDWMTDIVDGSDEDDLRLLSSPRADDSGEARFFEALESAEIVTAMDNTRIRIPGFIVPLAYDNRQRTIEFFLVPYFGACLHLPPPPPNQIIYVNYELGIDQHSMYEPVWVEGVLRAQPVSNAVANAAYRLNASVITPYHDTSGY
ncbi:MAG: hypothetical protein CMQ34_11755 [Gammaproteobacteria bacterium]|nr:hypothetical protein [Gammaproteobacteria bacterium]